MNTEIYTSIDLKQETASTQIHNAKVDIKKQIDKTGMKTGYVLEMYGINDELTYKVGVVDDKTDISAINPKEVRISTVKEFTCQHAIVDGDTLICLSCGVRCP